MNVLIAGYAYVRENFLHTFRPALEAGRVFALLPKIWKAKGGKVVFRAPAGKGITTSMALFNHSHYPVVGGLLKGWMPMFPAALWRLRGTLTAVYSPSEPVLLTTLYQGVWACLFGMRHVIFTWENVPYREKFSGLNLRIKELLIRLNYFFADGIVCGNPQAQVIVRSYTNKPTAVIPLSGVDETFFQPQSKADRSFAGHDLKGKLVYSFVGAIGYRKGVHLIIEAVSEIVRDLPQARLIIAGSGEYDAEIDTLIARHSVGEYVIRVPWVDHGQLRDLLSASDVFLYPSIPHGGWEEQFGYSIAEASLMELSVVSTRSGSIAELVQDGVTGMLIEAGNKEQLVRAMRSLGTNEELRRKMGHAGRRRMIERFSHQAVLEKFEGFFKQLNGGTR